MKKNILITLLFFPILLFSWERVYFEYQYSGAIGYDIVETSDKGFIAIGQAIDPHYHGSFYILRIDSIGNKIWEKIFHEERNFNGLNSMTKTNDGNFIALGTFLNIIIKFDINGNIIWEKDIGKKFPSYYSVHFYKIINDRDNGFILCGYASTDYHPLYRFGFVIKIDSIGNVLWNKVFDNYDSELASIDKTDDNAYVVVGYKDYPGYDYYMIKFNDVGILWEKSYAYSEYDDAAFSVKTDNDGNYIVGGYSTENKATLFKLNKNGDILWEQKFDPRSPIISICNSHNNNGYTMITGCLFNWPLGYHYIIYKTDKNGNKIWEKEFNYYNTGANGHSIKQTSDKGYIAVGVTNREHSSYHDIYIVKIDSTGSSSMKKYKTSIPKKKNPILYNSPNPFKTKTRIYYNIPQKGIVKIKIYNIKGQCIRILKAKHNSAGNYSILWNGKNDKNKNLSNNLYFYSLYLNNKVIKRKSMALFN